MDEIKETGGARIGMANATWPFATLIVNRNELQLKASILGTLIFKPSDIISIEPYIQIPVLGQGIKINHNVAACNQKVIFWTMGSPQALIARIEQTGFLTNTRPLPAELDSTITASQTSGGFPVKKPAAIAIIAIWNILILNYFIQIFIEKSNKVNINIGPQLALGFMFLVCLLLLISEPFRQLILKPGRSINDIRIFLFFTMFITGIIFLGFTFMPH
jgi:hypothetical protein